MLLVMLVAVSAVSAMDNVTDDTVVSTSENVTNDVFGVNDGTDCVQTNVENQSDETITIDNDENDAFESTEDDKISDSPGTFTELWSDISKGKLTRDYLDTESRTHGLYVYDSVGTIDGDGHTIDCNNQYGVVFDIKTKIVTITNCNFVNGTAAIIVTEYFKNQEIRILNCNFTNCGGISITSPTSNNLPSGDINFKILIKNCKFDNGYGFSSDSEFGNPMAFSYYTIEDCIFSNSKEGSISVYNGAPNRIHFNILNCEFVNNNNRENGGAIHIDVDKESNSYANCELIISNSNFINNSATNIGGAIYSNIDNIGIHNSKFISNNAIKGAAIYVVAINKDSLYVKMNIDNSLFLDNSGVLDDGIYVTDITHLSEGHINNCILLGSEYGSNPIVCSEKEFDGNYNWWGNTFDNPKQKPANVNKLVVQNWLILNITSIADNLYLGDVTQIKCNLSSVIDYTGNVNSYDYSNVLSVDFIAESSGVSDTFPFVGGYGEYNFTLNNAPISTLTIKCGNFQKTINFNVNKKTDLIVDVPDSCDDEKKLIINLPTNATGNITLIINNKTYNSTINDGKAVIDLSELPNGTYDYEINYSGNKIYNPFKGNGSLKVGHIATINANDMVTTYGEQSYFTATFYESNGAPLSNKYVAFKINNDETPIKTDSNGIAKLPIGLSPGEYNITSINDYTGESIVNKLIVKAADPKPIDDKNITISSLDGGSGTIKLPNDANGTITLDIAGKPYDFTVVNGVCDVQLPELANGFYGYVLTYSGDAKYTSFTKTGSFTINKPVTPTNQNTSNIPAKPSTSTTTTKPAAKITLTLKTVKVKKSAKKLILQATLKQGKKALSGKKITFKFNGKKYTAKTNKKGIAKVTIKKNVLKKLKVGKKVKYQVSYGKKAMSKKTATVKK